METIIFVGIQATGKSTFYKERFFRTHIRINLDMLKTRHREAILLQACLDAKQPFVVDNTNPTVEVRAKYIQQAKKHRFQVTGYYFQSRLEDALRRNEGRQGKERIPEKAILHTYNKLQIPTLDEGFDTLFYVMIDQQGHFIIRDWDNEI
jgi:predicted kinase